MRKVNLWVSHSSKYLFPNIWMMNVSWSTGATDHDRMWFYASDFPVMTTLLSVCPSIAFRWIITTTKVEPENSFSIFHHKYLWRYVIDVICVKQYIWREEQQRTLTNVNNPIRKNLCYSWICLKLMKKRRRS